MVDTFNATTSMAPHKHQNGIDPPAVSNPHDVSPTFSNRGEDDDHVRPMSPLHMPPGQIDGLDALKSENHLQHRGQSPHRRDPATSSLLHLNIPRCPSPADIALSAMQYLPYPLIVLNGLKTLAMANVAMGRLLGIEEDDGDKLSADGMSEMEKLKGQTLSQLGIDMLQDGRPVWVTWESFLDSLAENIGSHAEDAARQHASEYGEGDVTPTAERIEPFHTHPNSNKSNAMVHDSVVEVVLTQAGLAATPLARSQKAVNGKHTFAKMIITIWEIDDERFFTLTFTSTDSSQTSLPSSRAQSRQVLRASKHLSFSSTGSSSPSSVASRRSSKGSSSSSAITSPTNVSMSASPFPPLGPPSKSNVSGSPSTLQKVTMMKDALLDNTEVPIIAMWKDETLTIPNKAARRLFHPKADLQNVKDGFDLFTKWHVWDETFTTRIDPSEYPISILVRTQTPFSGRKIGLYDPETDRKIIFDCLGEAMTDEETGEFLAGILTCRDITSMTENMNEQINEIKEKDEQRFQLICDSMPQMIWTTLPDGRHDWFSQRW